jgi:hypothetical protein
MERVDRPQRAAGGSAGVRRRRQALYGPPPRLTRTSTLTGRLVWQIGDWGRASEHIGSRWEEIAAGLAGKRLGSAERLIVLSTPPELMAEVLGTGLPHADAVRAFKSDGRLSLEPLDFKWSLETASVKQVRADTLARLLDARLPRLDAELAATRAALGLHEEARVELLDGRFLAPEHPANRAALLDDPGLPVLVLRVDAQEFFRPLPGWTAARALARLEGLELERLTSLESVERYYRLGAGVLGALTRLETGLFEEDPRSVDAEARITELRRTGHAPTINTLLLDLERQIAARKVLEDRLAALPRAAYPFGRLRAELARLRVPPFVLESRGALGRAYGEVMREVSRTVTAAGRDMVASGIGQAEALSRLEVQPEQWAALAHEWTRALAERLRGSPAPE